jgi:hypothetical protein
MEKENVLSQSIVDLVLREKCRSDHLINFSLVNIVETFDSCFGNVVLPVFTAFCFDGKIERFYRENNLGAKTR